MFNFTVSVQEKPDGSVSAQTIELLAFKDDATPNERRVAEAIRKAVEMAHMAPPRTATRPGDDLPYAVGERSELEWAIRLAEHSTGGPLTAE